MDCHYPHHLCAEALPVELTLRPPRRIATRWDSNPRTPLILRAALYLAELIRSFLSDAGFEPATSALLLVPGVGFAPTIFRL